MFHRLKDIKPLREYMLLATFYDDTVKIYDVKPLFTRIDAFSSLQTTPKLFEQVKVDVGGFGICWNDEIDLSCDEIWDNGNLYDRSTPEKSKI